MFNLITKNMSCNIEEIDGMNDGTLETEPHDSYDGPGLDSIDPREWSHFSNNYRADIPSGLIPILQKIVNYVDEQISIYRNTQHMLGNPMISYDGKVAIVRTDLTAIHYYADKPNVSTTFWGYYETHMVNEGEWKVIKHKLTGIGAN